MGIINDNPTVNTGLIKSAANIISYRDKTIICVDRCIFTADIRFVEGYGNAVFGFK